MKKYLSRVILITLFGFIVGTLLRRTVRLSSSEPTLASPTEKITGKAGDVQNTVSKSGDIREEGGQIGLMALLDRIDRCITSADFARVHLAVRKAHRETKWLMTQLVDKWMSADREGLLDYLSQFDEEEDVVDWLLKKQLCDVSLKTMLMPQLLLLRLQPVHCLEKPGTAIVIGELAANGDPRAALGKALEVDPGQHFQLLAAFLKSGQINHQGKPLRLLRNRNPQRYRTYHVIVA